MIPHFSTRFFLFFSFFSPASPRKWTRPSCFILPLLFCLSWDWTFFFFFCVCVWVCSVWTFSSAILIVLIKLGSHTEFLRIMNYMWHNNWEKVTIFLFRWSSVLVCIFNRNRDRYAHIAVWMITMLFYSPVYFFFIFQLFKNWKNKDLFGRKKDPQSFFFCFTWFVCLHLSGLLFVF